MVIQLIRAVGVHPLLFGELDAERPTKERLLKLARISKKILDKYGGCKRCKDNVPSMHRVRPEPAY